MSEPTYLSPNPVPARDLLRGATRRTPDKLLAAPGLLVSRGLIYLTTALLATAAAWSVWTEVDVVVSAPGRIVVEGNPIEITAPESALVLEVAVKIGDRVAAGDVLLRLDSFVHASEAERLRGEIEALRVERDRHLQGSKDVADAARSLAVELDATESVHGLLVAQLEGSRALLDDGVLSRFDARVEERRVAESRARLARLRVEIESQSALALERQRRAEEASARIASLEVRRATLQELQRRATIRAPGAGVVTHLVVQHPGSVIDTARPAVILAPENRPLRVSIEIPNASMRRLERDLSARVELEAFPRQDFGYLEGRLVDIEPDADDAGNYRAWVSLDREELPGAGLLAKIRPGLRARVRVLIERRSLASYILKPFRSVTRRLEVLADSRGSGPRL